MSDAIDAADTSDTLAISQAGAREPRWPGRALRACGAAARSLGRGAQGAWGQRQRALAVLNGVVGDRLAAHGSALATPMALYEHAGQCLLVEPDDGAFPTSDQDAERVASSSVAGASRVCLFVHGSCDNERTWQHRDAGYGAGLREALGLVPLYLRYNSGLHISENGRALAALLSRLVVAQGALQELVLVGHSMGGLVIRSACHYGASDPAGAPWLACLRRVALLGVPHDGAHLERIGRLATGVMARVPDLTTRLIAHLGEFRSAGIKDLRHGYLVQEEWTGGGADRLLPTARRDLPLLAGVDYFVAMATLARDPAHWSARAFGDGLVHPASAAGERWVGQGLGLPADQLRVFPNTSHLGLVRSPAVYEALRQWLAGCDRQ